MRFLALRLFYIYFYNILFLYMDNLSDIEIISNSDLGIQSVIVFYIEYPDEYSITEILDDTDNDSINTNIISNKDNSIQTENIVNEYRESIVRDKNSNIFQIQV